MASLVICTGIKGMDLFPRDVIMLKYVPHSSELSIFQYANERNISWRLVSWLRGNLIEFLIRFRMKAKFDNGHVHLLTNVLLYQKIYRLNWI